MKSQCNNVKENCGCNCTITNIKPTSGPYNGGNNIVITGKNLQHVTYIWFGKHKITTFTLINNCTIEFMALPCDHTQDSIKIAVACSYSKSNQVCYTFVNKIPEITSYSPMSGPVASTTLVTVYGEGFDTTVSVLFGSTEIYNFTIINDNTLTFFVLSQGVALKSLPKTDTFGDNVVDFSIKGSGGMSNGATFTFVLPPMI